MKHFLKLLLLIAIVPGFLMAQGNYKQGYILSLKGDTVKGYINYRDWNSNPTSILFKRGLYDAATEKYSVANAAGFGLYGIEYYSRYTGSISTDQTDNSYLKTFIDTASRVDTVFLRVLTTGKNVTLYEYTDVIKTRYFISSATELPTELIYHAYLAGGDRVQKIRSFEQQLQALATTYRPQSTKIIDDIATADYTASSLKKIVLEINGSTGTTATGKLFIAKDQDGVRFFAGAGVNYANVHFIGANDFTTVAASTSIFPEINLGADIYFNKEVGNLLIRTTLNLTGNTANFNYNSGGSFPYNTVLKFDQYIIELQPQLLYNIYNTAALKFYVSAGGGVNFASYKNEQYYRVNPNGTITSTSLLSVGQPFEPRGAYFNLVTGLGVVLNNKIDIYAGYLPSITFDNEVNYGTQYSSIHAGLHYVFGK